MVDLPSTMVDLPNTILELLNTMVYLPNTRVDLPNTMVDLPNTMTDGIELVLLNHTCTRGPSVTRMRDFLTKVVRRTYGPTDRPTTRLLELLRAAKNSLYGTQSIS